MKETARRQQAFIQKSSYFPEICMMEGTTQVIARNCTKCYGRGHTRDRCLTVSICSEGERCIAYMEAL